MPPRPSEDRSREWLNRLDACAGDRELLGAVKDFIATWTPLELGRLPRGCEPGRIMDAHDVSEYAFALTQARLRFEGPITDASLLDRMTSFMTHAAMLFAHHASLNRAGIPIRY